MKKIIAIVLMLLMASISLLFSGCVTTDVLPSKETAAPKELQRLREWHPECFELDTTEGINVLMFYDGTGNWQVLLVSGSKDHFSMEEAGTAMEWYIPLTVEETKTILLFYDLPDEQIILRPYDGWPSSYGSPRSSEDQRKMAVAFDNRYRVGDLFQTVIEQD